MIRASTLLLASVLAACSPSPGTQADADEGVCFRVRNDAREVLDRRIANLQTCAQRLEAVRMMEGGEVRGAFEGSLLYATEAELTSARSADGKRYPVFEPEQRAEIQRAIRKLLDAQAAKAAASKS